MMSHHQKDPNKRLQIDIPNRTIVRTVLVVIGILLLLSFVRQAAYPLTLIFIALFLALALNAPVSWVQRHMPGKNHSRSVAMAVSFLAVIIFITGFFASIVPPLLNEAGNFIDAVPALVQQAQQPDNAIGQFIERYELQDEINSATEQLTGQLDNVGAQAIGVVGSIIGSVVALFTVLVLTFMMLLEGPRWVAIFHGLVPHSHKRRVAKVTGDMYKVIKGYVNGQVLLAFLAAIVLLPPFIILDMPYPAALVVVVFLFALIPLVGNTLGAIVVSLVGLTQSWAVALIILAYYILYQQIENYVLQPKIQANSTNMSPLLVFSAAIIGVSFAGILGALVAIPTAGCLRIVTLDYLRSKGLIAPNSVDTGVVKPGLENANTPAGK